MLVIKFKKGKIVGFNSESFEIFLGVLTISSKDGLQTIRLDNLEYIQVDGVKIYGGVM